MDLTECPGCGDPYDALGTHWERGSCDYPSLDPYADIITGLMMGDGTLNRMDGKNPALHVTTTEEDFAEHLRNVFGPITSSVGERDISRWKNEYGSKIHYEFRTRRHPGFDRWATWYDTGEKRFPDDVELSTTTINYWYAGDGTFSDRDGRLPEANIASLNEIDHIDWLRDHVEDETGLTATTYNKGLYFNSTDALEFFDKLDPLPGYEYKYPSEEEIERLQEEQGVSQ